MQLQQSLGLIKSLVAVCPLLGLLGTVTGMIEVFDVMAVMGTGSARAMASGISKATIPTMAGMVGALTGVFCHYRAPAQCPSQGSTPGRPTDFRPLSSDLCADPFNRFRARKPRKRDSIDVTPMLDVVFIMLIFFIVTASFVKESGLDVNRPDAETAEQKDRANILVAIGPEGDIWIDQRKVDVTSVRANIERLHAENPQGSVVIQADEEAATRHLVSVMDAARQAGVYNVSIAAQEP